MTEGGIGYTTFCLEFLELNWKDGKRPSRRQAAEKVHRLMRGNGIVPASIIEI